MARKFGTGLICLAVTCLAAVALLWASGFAFPQRGAERAHRDPLKVLLRGILL